MNHIATTPPNPTQWWSDNKDLLAFVLSLVALALSIWSTRKTVRGSEQTAKDIADRGEAMERVATLQRVHEALVDPKAARGRRLLFLAHKEGKYPGLGEGSWDEINYALALYDTLGGYIVNGQVDEDLALSLWHHPLTNIAVPVQEFVAHRNASAVHQPWAYLHELLRRAAAYQCHCPLSLPDSGPLGHS